MELLEGKVAVVTGAGRGIGRAVAIAYAAEGAKVVVTARSKHEIDAVAAEIEAAGGEALAIPADLTRSEEVDALFQQVQQQWGDTDILVNNAAGAGPMGMLWETRPEEWQAMFDVNVTSIVRCCKAVLPAMIRKRYGKIIIVGSGAGSGGASWAASVPELIGYGISKAAVNYLSVCLAQQVKPYGVNVNCLSVGATTQLALDHRVGMATLRGQTPPPALKDISAGELVLPEENAAAFVFLASSSADHITGQYFEANSLPDRLRRG